MWMQTHPERLRALLDREADGQEDLAPAGDPAVRAHLAFVAEALAANAAPASADALGRFAAPSPTRLAQAAVDLYAWPVSLSDTRARACWEQPADEPGYGIAAPAAEAALLYE